MPRLAALLVLGLLACDRQVAGGAADGPRVFAEACARCHGPGGQPPVQMVQSLGVKDLTAPEFVARRNRDLIVHQVKYGAQNGRMPSFAGALTEPQMHAVADYVMQLGR